MFRNTAIETYILSGRLLLRLKVFFSNTVWNQEIWSHVLEAKSNREGICADDFASMSENA